MTRHPLLEFLPALPPQHHTALEWFQEHAGQEVPWPQPLPDGTLLASKAKGIYKPQWSKYALSVRQSLLGPYPDKEVIHGLDGTWTYQYYQERLDADLRDAIFTNRGLVLCRDDLVPVGVMIQTQPKPIVRYRILGLALVTGWDEGYFYFQGFEDFRVRDVHFQDKRPGLLTDPQSRADAIASVFNPKTVEDERRKVLAVIAQRQGQVGFRKTLLKAYGGRCAVTAYDASEALEAAHIVPYRGPVTNHPSNGLLLRADLHSLFDYGLVAVDTTSELRLLVSKEIEQTAYRQMKGRVLKVPDDPALRPSLEALKQHRDWASI
jgi:hypothetical protein